MIELDPEDGVAVELLHGLVGIPSLSRQEGAASRWLVAQMANLGYDRAYVDGAGNALGELGSTDAARTVILLGHIDTVPGEIPVRIAESEEGPALYGRGSVDAKGPLAAFVAAGARLGGGWASTHGVRIVVVGAVEEEAATSRGARFIRDRFDGSHEARPAACIIGEPSGATRITLGYKGRLLLDLDAWQPMAHTAGPDAGIAVAAVELWSVVATSAAAANIGVERAFDQLQPSLRRLATFTDSDLNEHVQAQIALRLPLRWDAAALANAIGTWAARWTEMACPPFPLPKPEQPVELHLAGERTSVRIAFSAQEDAWRSERSTPIARNFLTAIRTVDPEARPTFLVKTGTSDMNVVGPAWGCPIVAYGPGDSALDHTPHEHLPLQEYLTAVQILEHALRDFASISE